MTVKTLICIYKSVLTVIFSFVQCVMRCMFVKILIFVNIFRYVREN